jgi:hypothetical protein
MKLLRDVGSRLTLRWSILCGKKTDVARLRTITVPAPLTLRDLPDADRQSTRTFPDSDAIPAQRCWTPSEHHGCAPEVAVA